MGLARGLVEAAADDAAILHQHRADARIRIGAVEALLREAQGFGHVLAVFGAELAHGCFFLSSGNKGICSRSSAARADSPCSRSISSRNSFTSWKLRYT